MVKQVSEQHRREHNNHIFFLHGINHTCDNLSLSFDDFVQSLKTHNTFSAPEFAV